MATKTTKTQTASAPSAPAAKTKKTAQKQDGKKAAKSTAPAKTGKSAKAAKTARVSKAPKAAPIPKAAKPKKPKLVRDNFTMPKDEHAVLATLKERAARLGRPAKKNEVLRAGLQALAAMGDAAFLASVGSVPDAKAPRAAKA